VGKPTFGTHADTGATGHALPFVPVGHTCSPTETTRKSTRTDQRLSSKASNSLSGHLQNERQAEKEQKGSLCLRFLVGFFSSSLVFLGSEP
jgi:hypothetical protein